MTPQISRRTSLCDLWFLCGLVFVLLCALCGSAEESDWAAMIEQLEQDFGHTPQNETTRRQLAIAHNNYAIRLAEAEQLQQAQQHLEEALRLEPTDQQFQENLARIHLQQAQEAHQHHRASDAREAITQSLKLNPKEVSAYVLLGEVEYDSQRLKEARAAWQKALALEPGREDAAKRLEQLNQEFPVESDFERLSQAYFDIRYTESIERSKGFDVRDDLLEARRSVGSDFQHWPKYKLIVLLYGAEQFRAMRSGTPDWLAGQYDGKIRVPLPGQGLDRAAVKRTLIHEYTHAVIHDLTKGHLPMWLNEGLAEYEAWKGQQPAWSSLRQALKDDHLVPWDQLSSNFSMSLSTETVALAYEQSHSIVRYLVERYGFWRMRRLIKTLAGSPPGETPFEETLAVEFHVKPARLQSEWRKWLDGLLARPPT